jgi:hypothetical protein
MPDMMMRTPPERILRRGEEERDMDPETHKGMRAKVEQVAKPKAIGCAVVGGVVLAVILAWFFGFFSWLLS